MTNESEPASSQPARPSLLKALWMTLSVIPLIGGYTVLCSLLGNTEFYSGFLFLLCWAGFHQLRLATLPNAALGSALGLALGYALKLLVGGALGASGGYLFGVLVLPVIYCSIVGWLPLLVNFSCMTFLATTTISHIQAHADFRAMLIGLTLGVIYFGLVLGTIERLSARRKSA